MSTVNGQASTVTSTAKATAAASSARRIRTAIDATRRAVAAVQALTEQEAETLASILIAEIRRRHPERGEPS